MVFTGTYEHSIDAKNRLAIPAEIRSLLQHQSGDRAHQPVHLYVSLGENATLCLYTEEAFERRADELDRSPLDTEELLAYERLMFSLARRVEIDKQGRVLLPENLLKMSGLGSEVVLIGVKDHLEIRDRQSWLDHVQELLKNKPGILRNPRWLMRPAAAGSATTDTSANAAAPGATATPEA